MRKRFKSILKKHPYIPIPNANYYSQTLQQIAKRTDIIIKTSDKNLGLTAMDRTWYINTGLSDIQLGDKKTYLQIEKQPEPNTLENNLCSILNTHSKLHTKNFNKSRLAKLLLTDFNRKTIKPCIMYFNPKIHKPPPLSLRPICSSIHCATYNASIYLDQKLQPILNHIPSYTKDSFQIVNDLNTLTLPHKNCYIFTADIDKMYPSIDIPECIISLKTILTKHNFTDINFTCDLTHWILTNNYITFENMHFLQISGIAMGTPLAVILAVLYIAILEDETTNIILHNDLHNQPIYYKRYIDDLFGITRTKEDAEFFLSTLHHRRPNIKLTPTPFDISHSTGNFLDLKIYKGKKHNENLKLDIELFQKPTNKFLFLPYNSFHDIKTQRGWITSYRKRIHINCTETIAATKHDLAFKQQLKERGFPDNILKKLFSDTWERNTLIQKRKEKHKNETNTTPLLLKLPLCSRTKTMLKHIKNATSFPKKINNDPTLEQLFNTKRHPTICIMNSPNISKLIITSNSTSTPDINN